MLLFLFGSYECVGSGTSHGTLYVYDQGTTHSVMSVFAVFLALLLKN